VFVANTHTPMLFFSSRGMVYKLKVYKLPLGNPQARGRALVNMLPLADGETISTVMALPEDEDTWGDLFVMFATKNANVRRNRLSDFTNVMANGKIAMKLDDGDALVRVRTCTEDDDVLLSAASGKCIRFPVTDVRVFAGRSSTGVRGMRLKDGDAVIAMSVLRHVDVTSEEARAYLKHAAALRRASTGEDEDLGDEDDGGEEAVLSPERIIELGAAEEFVLTIADDGMGKRSSAYDYRVTGRGGKGLVAQNIWGRDKKKGPVKKVAQSFPVDDGDQVMLVTDGGQLIRTPVDQIRIAGRSTGGVWVLRTAEGERVVSVARLVEDAENVIEEGGGAE
jgi:DNA gyrase subunit A